MKTKPPIAVLLMCACALTFCIATARAQSTRSGTTAVIGGRVVTTSGTVPLADAGTPSADAKVSSRASAAILSGFKYDPPPPPKPEEDEVDLRDVDKPQNDIIRLPKYTVTAKRAPVFNERTLYTQDQLKKLAIARYLSSLDKKLLNRWTFSDVGLAIGSSNEDRAMQTYLDDERKKNMAVTNQQISNMQSQGDSSSAKQAKNEYYDMFLRPQDKTNMLPDSLNKQLGK